MYCHRSLLLIFGIAVLGCGGGQFETYPVKGSVKFPNGAPLAGGSVEFQSIEDFAKRLTARGRIDENGHFEMSTFEPNDGVIAGKHRVIVAPALPPGKINPYQKPKPLVNNKYLRFETSGLEFTVDPHENNYFDIVVER